MSHLKARAWKASRKRRKPFHLIINAAIFGVWGVAILNLGFPTFFLSIGILLIGVIGLIIVTK